ncbi:MAG: hypothetical protein QM703_26785 [Gemmatales bacterium]
MLVFVKELCPHCRAFCGINLLFGMSSGIGPTVYQCSNCRKDFTTDRREWSEMQPWFNREDAGKLRYLFVSLVYLFLIGILGGAFVATGIRFISSGPQIEEVPLSQFVSYWPYSVFVAATIGFIQILRVWLSKQRSLHTLQPTYVASFFSVHTNLQSLVLIAILILMGICWLVGYVLHR